MLLASVNSVNERVVDKSKGGLDVRKLLRRLDSLLEQLGR
jgi:hypothetical protein